MGDLATKPFERFKKPFSLDPYHIFHPKKPPPQPAPAVMPDPEEVARAKKRAFIKEQGSSGRESTILSSVDKLGG